MKTTLQIGDRIETFSDAPLRAGGIVTRPRWAWSDAYRAEVRKQLAKPRDNEDRDAHRTRLYKAWLAERDAKRGADE